MKLLISCPNCHTSYQIDEASVESSDGQAQCSQCHSVFNALHNSQPIPLDGSISELNLPFSEEVVTRHAQPDYSELLEDYADREVNSLFIKDNNSDIVNGPDDIALQDSSVISPEQLLDIDGIDLGELPTIEPLHIDHSEVKTTKPYSNTATTSWLFLILILLAIFIMQVSWYNRAEILLNPQARNVFESVCQTIGCSLPPRRDPDAFEIIERTVSMHPEVHGVLNIKILFTNQADFEQPLPGLTLSLYDMFHNLISRRSFQYKSYLNHYSRKSPILKSGQTQAVILNLEDPGQDVTGFEFDFF